MKINKIKRQKRQLIKTQEKILSQLTAKSTIELLSEEILDNKKELIMLEIIHAETIFLKAHELELNQYRIIKKGRIIYDIYTPYINYKTKKHQELEQLILDHKISN